MKSYLRLALLSLCALILASSFSVPRVMPVGRAALERNEEGRVVSCAPGAVADSRQKAGGQNKRAGTTASAVVVREVDVVGLKKLLSREGKNGRPLLVNFWATWCEPCRAEFPDLVKIDDEYRGRGLEFIAVSLDEVSEINTTVPQFLKEMRARMPAYLLNTTEPEAAIQFVDPRWSGTLPATFLFDAQGKVVFNHKGRIKPDELRSAINTVISDK
jgi:thiol-disulfide isomerase/thioredoxin